MNWKVILGVIMALAGATEAYNIVNDYNTGVTQFNPIYGMLGSIAFAAGGIYLVIKGRQKSKKF